MSIRARRIPGRLPGVTPGSALKLLIAVMLLSTPGLQSSAETARLLIYQRNGKGFVHDNLAVTAQALREIAAENKWVAEVSTNAAVFSDNNLKRYRAVIFANSNNEAFENDEERAAFQRYLKSGGGFIGIHSSTGSERNWRWFQQMQGGKFHRHSPLQTFTVQVVDQSHPATAHYPANWRWTDECYFFTNLNPGIRVLLAADTTTLRDPKLDSLPGETLGGLFPLAWCHEGEGGRRFYTSLGHKIEHYSDPGFREHLRGGIRWVLGISAKNDPSTHP